MTWFDVLLWLSKKNGELGTNGVLICTLNGLTTIFVFQVSAWGGYVFIINLIPLHVFVLLIMGRYSKRIFIGKNC